MMPIFRLSKTRNPRSMAGMVPRRSTCRSRRASSLEAFALRGRSDPESDPMTGAELALGPAPVNISK
jgi:hypothetical protein